MLPFTLSVGYSNAGRLLAAARPHLVALTKEMTWPVSLVTHVGPSMVVRDSTHAMTSLTFVNYAPGYTMPLLECASGHAYLAHLPDDERANILAGIEIAERRSDMLEMFKGDKLVQGIREKGFATCHRNPHTPCPGKTSSIAVPVFEDGRVAGTLTLVFFATSMPMSDAVARYAPALKAAAAALSTELDGRGEGRTAPERPPLPARPPLPRRAPEPVAHC